jgi:hypothetical protein
MTTRTIEDGILFWVIDGAGGARVDLGLRLCKFMFRRCLDLCELRPALC